MLQHNTHVLCNCIAILNTMGENEIETRAEFKPNLNADAFTTELYWSSGIRDGHRHSSNLNVNVMCI